MLNSWGLVERFKNQMEPPKGCIASFVHFLVFLPYFTALLFLGVIKGMTFRVFFFFLNIVSMFHTLSLHSSV